MRPRKIGELPQRPRTLRRVGRAVAPMADEEHEADGSDPEELEGVPDEQQD